MISQETAREIYNSYREIEAGKKLLMDIEESQKDFDRIQKKTDPCLKDAFGRCMHFELGIPSGKSGHRILRVRPDLAGSIIRAHIADKEAELLRVQEMARIEMA